MYGLSLNLFKKKKKKKRRESNQISGAAEILEKSEMYIQLLSKEYVPNRDKGGIGRKGQKRKKKKKNKKEKEKEKENRRKQEQHKEGKARRESLNFVW